MIPWENIDGKDGGHYTIQRLRKGSNAMEALRAIFNDAKADELNFVLFSTSGIHGTYQTIEEEEAASDGEKCGITFVIVHPRLVTLKYGVCHPETADDFNFLKYLRQSSWDVVKTIGAV